MNLDHRSGSREIADHTYRQPDDPGVDSMDDFADSCQLADPDCGSSPWPGVALIGLLLLIFGGSVWGVWYVSNWSTYMEEAR